MYQFKECRELRGYSQNYVALSLGVKPPSVNSWEKGKTKPTLDNLIALSGLLNVTTDMLLGLKPLNDSKPQDEAPAETDHTILDLLYQLNEEGQEKVVEYADDLLQSGKYIKIHSPGMAQEA